MAEEEMRAADTDRQVVADRLKSALDEGRLDLHEYDERLQRAYAAKTYGELEKLTTDLPVNQQLTRRTAAPPVMGVAGSAATDPGLTRRWVIHVWDEYVTTVAICLAIWVIVGMAGDEGFGYFWPAWVIGPWGLLLIWQTFTGLAQGEPQKWQAKAERKKAKKERKAAEEAGD
jgi:Domain of unknown function (DUF1707)